MNYSRRSFVKAATSALALPAWYPLRGSSAETKDWKTYEVITAVAIDSPEDRVQAWLPLPLVKDTEYFKTVSIQVDGDAKKTTTFNTSNGDARMLWVQWDATSLTRSIMTQFVVMARERNFALPTDGPSNTLEPAAQKYWTRATELLPTDGIVKQKALEITQSLGKGASDYDKAFAIYNWVVDNTFRDAATRGCGVGDVKLMLETNRLGGKCADINAVFVALARALGIAARDVYGIRVGDSARGYRSLGKSGDITKAQHCRAEFFMNGHGWVPVDPADVRKVILEEPGNLTINDPKVSSIREYLFGNWEMNWMPYNYGHDILLPGSALGARGNIPFLMYPQAETNDGRSDALDPATFKYSITSRQVA